MEEGEKYALWEWVSHQTGPGACFSTTETLSSCLPSAETKWEEVNAVEGPLLLSGLIPPLSFLQGTQHGPGTGQAL